jgi:hypothetical protein
MRRKRSGRRGRRRRKLNVGLHAWSQDLKIARIPSGLLTSVSSSNERLPSPASSQSRSKGWILSGKLEIESENAGLAPGAGATFTGDDMLI